MIIYEPTIQSTGTHFLANLIRMHKQVVYFDSWQNAQRGESKERLAEIKDCPDKYALVTVHIGIANEYWDNPVYHTNETTKEDYMQEADYTVIPIRDPLKALLTCHTRNWDMIEIGHIVNGFLQVAEWVEKYDNIHFFPVDLMSHMSILPQVHLPDHSSRYEEIRKLFDFLDLPLEPYVMHIAEHWPLVNSMGERFTRVCNNMYYSGRVDLIVQELEASKGYEGDNWNLLCEAEDKLRPWLESLGYRSLTWWTKP